MIRSGNFGKYEGNLEAIQKLHIENNLILEKALKSTSPSNILKASTIIKEMKGANQKGGRAMLFDPFNFYNSVGYKDKPVRMSYAVLRQMAKTHIIKSIVGTRVEQVARFSQFQSDENKIGWSIRKKKRFFLEEDSNLSDKEKFEAEKLVNFINDCSVRKDIWGQNSFDSFLRGLVKDSLELDQQTFEVVRNRAGMLTKFYPVDAETFRFASDEVRNDPEKVWKGYNPTIVQLYQGNVSQEFYPWEIGFGIRNVSTNIRNNGYGISELEDMIKIVTWMIYSDQYNGNFFSQGAAPKGILSLKDVDPDNDKVEEFKQNWKMNVAGVQNSWKAPILPGGIEWIDLQKTNQDMQFSTWQEYLIRVSCSVYKMDPTEAGYMIGSGGEGTANYENGTEHRLNFSKDKGLYPLLRFEESQINQMIVGPASNYKYEFFFTGIEENVENISLDDDIKKLNAGILSWKDIRKKYNLPTKIDKDDFLMNATWIQWKQQQMMGSQQSNSFMDALDNEDDSNPFKQALSPIIMEHKKQNENPFVKGLNSFVEESFKK